MSKRSAAEKIVRGNEAGEVLHVAVLAANGQAERRWAEQVERALGGRVDVEVHGFGEAGDESRDRLVLIDATLGDFERHFEAGRRGRAVFLIVSETQQGDDRVLSALSDGRVDDVLVHPFRELEVQSKLQHYRQILLLDEVGRLNAGFGELVRKLEQDLAIVENLQKAKLPTRFPDVKGFRVTSRYLAGLRSGGDHVDLADSRDGQQMAILLSDSSSYGLSSAVLGVLMRVAVKLSVDEVRSSRDTVRKIQDELLAALRETDRLSLFYGVVSRKDFRLRFVNLGSTRVFHAPAGQHFRVLPTQGEALERAKRFSPEGEEGSVQLEPDDRLAVISDGYLDIVGGTAAMEALLTRYRKQDPKDTLNELAFRVKSKLQSEEDLPEQDCTALLIDVDSRVLRLKRN